MGKVIAAITTSVDGYIVGPNDRPAQGLGIGGERLHYWVMGGPWTYADDGHDTDGMSGADREYFDALTDGLGCGIVGRNMYDAAGAWGGTNPYPGTLIVLTHRTEDQPDPSTGFLFIGCFDAALQKARELAGNDAVSLGGGADLIRQGLAAGVVDELAVRHPCALRRQAPRAGVRHAVTASPSEPVRRLVPRLVQLHVVGAGHFHHRHDPVPVVIRPRAELRALGP